MCVRAFLAIHGAVSGHVSDLLCCSSGYCGGELLFLTFFLYELWQRHKSADEGIDGFMKTGWNCCLARALPCEANGLCPVAGYDAFLILLCFLDACV